MYFSERIKDIDVQFGHHLDKRLCQNFTILDPKNNSKAYKFYKFWRLYRKNQMIIYKTISSLKKKINLVKGEIIYNEKLVIQVIIAMIVLTCFAEINCNPSRYTGHEWARRTKFLLSFMYGLPRRHSCSSELQLIRLHEYRLDLL